MSRYFEKLTEQASAMFTNMAALTYPKDIQTPRGYPDPRYLLADAMSGAVYMAEERNVHKDEAVTSMHCTVTALVRYQVPTYFVAPGLCEALINTDPPDMLLGELMWPMPAMMFILPEAFTIQLVGAPVLHICAARLPSPSMLKSPFRFRDGRTIPEIEVGNKSPLIMFTYMVIERGQPVFYDSHSPVLREGDNSPVTMPELMLPDIKYFSKVGREENPAADTKLANKLTTLTLNLILAMQAEPELVTGERILRPTKKKADRVIHRALWSPNVIGQGFKVEYASPALGTGSHASPHAHWRRGHWRNQHHGPGNSLIKRLWIRPVFVGLVAE